MKYSGVVYWDGTFDPLGTITGAVLTPTRVSIDWEGVGEGEGHLDAEAREGDRYKGEYGYKERIEKGSFDLKRYDAEGEVILFGTWTWPPTGEAGTWAIVLKPVGPHKS